MRNLAKVRNLRLRLEQLEDRLQPSVGLFGDPLAADPLTGQVENNSSDVQVVADATVSQDAATAGQAVTVTPQQTPVQVSQAPGQVTADQTAALQVILNAGGAASVSTVGKQGLAVESHALTGVTGADYVLGTPDSPMLPVDVSNFTITTVQCGEEGPSAQDFTWSQYRGGAGIEGNFRTDATDAGVVYSAGYGTHPTDPDTAGTVTMRNGNTCTTGYISTVEENFLLLYGVNVAVAGGSVYTAGFDVFTGIAYLFKVSADLTTIEAGIQSPSAVALNFFFDVVNDAAGNRYVVGMTQNQDGTNGVRLSKLDANLTLPPAYDVVITFTDAGNPVQSFGLSLDVNATGEVYAGGGIVYAANDVDNVTIRLNAAGTGVDWASRLGFPATGPVSGPNGGAYGVDVQGNAVFITGIIADPDVPDDDLLLVARWADAATPTLVGGAGWGFVDPGLDLHGYGVAASSDLQPIVVGAVTGPEGDTDGEIFKFGTALNTIVGEDFIANPTLDPNKDEWLYGVALIGSAASADFAMAGDTTSDDLEPIINPCTGEGTLEGAIDGFMARYAQPLP